MKKILILLMLVLSGISAKAQTIENLDEIALLGKWNVTEVYGEFNNLIEGYKPTYIAFHEGEYSFVYYEELNDPPYVTPEYFFNTFWIGGTSTGKYTLHLLRQLDGKITVNFVHFSIDNFTGTEMTLSTYDGKGTMYLVKDTSTGVNSMEVERAKANGKMYSVGGMELDSPTKGITIKNEKKSLTK